MENYCPYGCNRGWIEVESHIGTVCPIHPPNMPRQLEAADVEPIDKPPRKLRRADYHNYLRTSEWQRRRRHALDRADHRCVNCGAKGPLQVHHLTYERLGYEEPFDLMPLCERCHQATHGLLPELPT